MKIQAVIRLSALVAVIAFSFLFIKSKVAIYKAFTDWKYANYFLATNSPQIAIETYEELYPALKREGMFLQQYGKALSLNGDHKKSVDILNQATAYGSDIYLYATLGDNYKALGQKEKAAAAYQKAIDMAPHKFFAPYLLATLHFETGDTARARQIAKKLLKKPVKVHSTAIDEIKQEMKNILTAGDPENKGPETERVKPSTFGKDTGGKNDV